MIKTKTVTITVDLSVEVPVSYDEHDINQITFEIPLGDIAVHHIEKGPIPSAEVTSYCTQEYYPDPE